MNKTVTINISGIVFHIEEDAYQKLSRYLDAIKGYFKDSESRKEIMADIEARIAELFQAKITPSRQVIVMDDIQEMIAVMGQPEEFAGEEGTSYSEETKEPFSAPGYEGKRQKRVFRDTDDKVLGGVCSGIGAYFGIDPLWLRIAFAVAMFFGFGFLFYILLWIIIPPARTTAEKLEMRGEHVNINNISKAISEEFEHLKKKVKDFEKEAGSKIKDYDSKGRMRGDKIINFLTTIFGAFFQFLAKFIAVILIIVGVVVITALIASLFGNTRIVTLNSTHFSLEGLYHSVYVSEELITLAIIGILLFIGVPLVMMVYAGIKVLLGIKTKNKIVRTLATISWIGGLIICIYLVIRATDEFSEKDKLEQSISLRQPAADTLFLKVREESKNDKSPDVKVVLNDWHLVIDDDLKYISGKPRLDIVKSETDSFELIMLSSARARYKKEALTNAKKIKYQVVQYDSLLEFDQYFSIVNDEKWRDQRLQLVLRVPVNKVIRLSKNMKHIIYDIKNTSDAWDSDMVNRRWKMTEDGLVCIDCQGLEDPNKHIIPPLPPVEPFMQEKERGN